MSDGEARERLDRIERKLDTLAEMVRLVAEGAGKIGTTRVVELYRKTFAPAEEEW